MRTINYTVGLDSIKPSTVQLVGFAGENCATKLVFAIDGEFWDKISSEQGVSIMLECIYNSGEYDAFVLKQDVVDAPESVTFDIPKEITELGGRVTMQLSFVELDVDFKIKRKLFAYPVKLRFAPSTSGGIENTVEYERYHTDVLSAMIRAEQATGNANDHATAAKTSAESAAAAAGNANDHATAAKTSAESAESAAARAEAAANNVVSKKKWVAIDTITLTQAMNAVEFTTPFAENKYTGVIVELEVAGEETYANTSAKIDVVPNSQTWGTQTSIPVLTSGTSKTPYTKMYFEFQNGMWQGWWQTASNKSTSTTHAMNNINQIWLADDDWIKNVKVYCNNSADKFPEGTKIRLWGVK